MGPRTSLLLALVVGWAAATAAAQAPDGAPTVLPTTPIAEPLVPVAQPAPATPPAPLVPGPASPPAALPAPAAVPPCPTPVPGVTSPPAEAKPPTLEELAKKVEVLGKNLTVTTGDGDFKLVLGGAVVADFLSSTRSPSAPGPPFFLFPKPPSAFTSQPFEATAGRPNFSAFSPGREW